MYSYIDTLKKVVEKLNLVYKPKRIWNFDEIGFYLNTSKSKTVRCYGWVWLKPALHVRLTENTFQF